jgi:NifU-like protein involved in Fe-S cluster formation
MVSELYSHAILRLAASLPHDEHLPQPGASAESRSPICGSRISAEINCDGDGRIVQIALRANACALGQASAAILRRHAAGQNERSIGEIRTDIAAYLSDNNDLKTNWPELNDLGGARNYPARHAAILLPYDAVLAAFTKAK